MIIKYNNTGRTLHQWCNG